MLTNQQYVPSNINLPSNIIGYIHHPEILRNVKYSQWRKYFTRVKKSKRHSKLKHHKLRGSSGKVIYLRKIGNRSTNRSFKSDLHSENSTLSTFSVHRKSSIKRLILTLSDKLHRKGLSPFQNLHAVFDAETDHYNDSMPVQTTSKSNIPTYIGSNLFPTRTIIPSRFDSSCRRNHILKDSCDKMTSTPTTATSSTDSGNSHLFNKINVTSNMSTPVSHYSYISNISMNSSTTNSSKALYKKRGNIFGILKSFILSLIVISIYLLYDMVTIQFTWKTPVSLNTINQDNSNSISSPSSVFVSDNYTQESIDNMMMTSSSSLSSSSFNTYDTSIVMTSLTTWSTSNIDILKDQYMNILHPHKPWISMSMSSSIYASAADSLDDDSNNNNDSNETSIYGRGDQSVNIKDMTLSQLLSEKKRHYIDSSSSSSSSLSSSSSSSSSSCILSDDTIKGIDLHVDVIVDVHPLNTAAATVAAVAEREATVKKSITTTLTKKKHDGPLDDILEYLIMID